MSTQPTLTLSTKTLSSRKFHIEAWFIFYGDVCNKIIKTDRRKGLEYLFEVLPPKTQSVMLTLDRNHSIKVVKR